MTRLQKFVEIFGYPPRMDKCPFCCYRECKNCNIEGMKLYWNGEYDESWNSLINIGENITNEEVFFLVFTEYPHKNAMHYYSDWWESKYVKPVNGKAEDTNVGFFNEFFYMHMALFDIIHYLDQSDSLVSKDKIKEIIFRNLFENTKEVEDDEH